MTNGPWLRKYATHIHTHTHTHKRTLTRSSSLARTVHTSVLMTVYNCSSVHNTTQNSSDNLHSYTSHNHHSSDVVYWREGRELITIVQKNAYLPRRPPGTDLHQIWYSGSSRQPNHPWQFFGNRRKGFDHV